ncbi:MAG: XRE family transcriptional regulator [Lysobacteraceae bacterium]
MQDYTFRMTVTETSSGLPKAMGLRIGFARNALKLTQDKLSEVLGFSDRQTLSAIENGERRVKPEELVALSEALGRPVDWFMDPFVVAGEGTFSWRVNDSVTDEVLRSFEERSGAWVGLLRFLRASKRERLKPFSNILKMDARATFEEATAMGEAVAADLELGHVPAERLIEQVESRLDIPVLFVDGPSPTGEISGAMCRLPDLGVILINRQELPARRHFDLAHELFHALTWDAMEPEHRESPTPDESSRKQGRRYRIERLADNFAAGLLMPWASLKRVIDRERLADTEHLAEVAKLLQVSTKSLAYRLMNAQLIDKTTCEALCKMRCPQIMGPTPKRFSQSFVKHVHEGIDDGYIATRKTAVTLGLTISQLAELFEEHDLPVPFAT